MDVALASAQETPQEPQFVRLVRLASQPFEARPSQFPKPVLHPPMTQAPPEHAADPFAAAQALPQAPQFARST